MLSFREEIFKGSVDKCALYLCLVPRNLTLYSDYLRLTTMRLRYNSPTVLRVFLKNWYKIYFLAFSTHLTTWKQSHSVPNLWQPAFSALNFPLSWTVSFFILWDYYHVFSLFPFLHRNPQCHPYLFGIHGLFFFVDFFPLNILIWSAQSI